MKNDSETLKSLNERFKELVELQEQGALDGWIEQTFIKKESSGKQEKRSAKKITPAKMREGIMTALREDNSVALLKLLEDQKGYTKRFGVLVDQVLKDSDTSLWEMIVQHKAYYCAKAMIDKGFSPYQVMVEHWVEASAEQWAEMVEKKAPVMPWSGAGADGHSKEHTDQIKQYATQAKSILKKAYEIDAQRTHLWVDEKGNICVKQPEGVEQSGALWRQVEALSWLLSEEQCAQQLAVSVLTQRKFWKEKADPMVKLVLDQIPKEFIECLLVRGYIKNAHLLDYMWEYVGVEKDQGVYLERWYKENKSKSQWVQIKNTSMQLEPYVSEKALVIALLQEHVSVLLESDYAQNISSWFKIVKGLFDGAVGQMEQEQKCIEKDAQWRQRVPKVDMLIKKEGFYGVKERVNPNHVEQYYKEYIERLEKWVQAVEEKHQILGTQSGWGFEEVMPARSLRDWIVQKVLSQRTGNIEELKEYETQMLRFLVYALAGGEKRIGALQVDEIYMSATVAPNIIYDYALNSDAFKELKVPLSVYAIGSNKQMLAKVLWSDEEIRRRTLSDEKSLSLLSRLVGEDKVKNLEAWGVDLRQIVEPMTGNNIMHNWFSEGYGKYRGFDWIKKFPELMWQTNAQGKTPVDLLSLSDREKAQWTKMQAERLKKELKDHGEQRIEALAQAQAQAVSEIGQEKDGELSVEEQLEKVKKQVLRGQVKKRGSGFKSAL